LICEECNERPAALHFTKVINGEKTEVHLCEKCAHEKGEMFIFNGNPGFSINNLLAGLLNVNAHPGFSQAKPAAMPHEEIIQCPVCHMTIQQFGKVGRFGCSACYESFKSRLYPILKRLHGGNTAHQGKIPKKIGGSLHVKKRIGELKEELQRLIAKEEFEQAAAIRDEIRSLEKKLLDQGGES